MRPLIAIDVDGPLNPWAAHPKPPNYRLFELKVGWWRKLKVWLDPDHGAQLRQLATDVGAELAWATSWGDSANHQLAPLVGVHQSRRAEFVHKRRRLTTRLIEIDPAIGITAAHLSEAREALS